MEKDLNWMAIRVCFVGLSSPGCMQTYVGVGEADRFH